MTKKIKCCQCNKEHDPDLDTFFTVAGHIYIGQKGGILGNGKDKDNSLDHFCRKESCAYEFLSEYTLSQKKEST